MGKLVIEETCEHLGNVDPYLAMGLATKWQGFFFNGNEIIITEIPELSQNRAKGEQRLFRRRVFEPDKVEQEIASCPTSHFALALPLNPDRPKPIFNVPPLKNAPSFQNRSSGDCNPEQKSEVLLGVIDDACPFADFGLRDASGKGTRVLKIWEQGVIAASSGGAPFGKEWSRTALNGLLKKYGNDEASIYRSVGRRRLLKRLSHGAHVLSLFASRTGTRSAWGDQFSERPLRKQIIDKASDADIVFVSLPEPVVQAPTRGSQDSYILDAVQYILTNRGNASEVVIVCDYGSALGPHDGNSLFDMELKAIRDDWLAKNIKIHFVVPTGNSYQSKTHARYQQIKTGNFSDATLDIELPPANETQVLAEVWIKGRLTEKARAAVCGPFKLNKSFSVKLGHTTTMRACGRVLLSAHFGAYNKDADGHCLLVQFGQTFQRLDGIACLPSGRWTIGFRHITLCNGAEAHAYLSNGKQVLGTAKRSSQAHFRDAPDERIDTSKNYWAPDQLGTMTNISGGPASIAIASTDMRYEPADYSGAGPTRGKKLGPEFAAVSEEGLAFRGIRGQGNLSATTFRMAGTSTAAPKAAREIAEFGDLQAHVPSCPPTSRVGEGVLDYFAR